MGVVEASHGRLDLRVQSQGVKPGAEQEGHAGMKFGRLYFPTALDLECLFLEEN